MTVPNEFDNNKKIYKPLISKKEILEEIKNVLKQENNKQSDCISLYDVLNLIKETNSIFDEMDLRYHNLICNIIDESDTDYYSYDVVGPNFNYEKEELTLTLIKDKGFEDICFSKKNGNLYIKHTNATDTKKIFAILSGVLSNCYDDFMKYKQFYSEYKSRIRPVNSNFFISIHNYKISLYSSALEITSDFVLYNDINDNRYKYSCNSNQILNAVTKYEDKIFKKIYIKIDDCPKWSRDVLYYFRKKELNEENKIKEMRKQKVLKIFPFLKK